MQRDRDYRDMLRELMEASYDCGHFGYSKGATSCSYHHALSRQRNVLKELRDLISSLVNEQELYDALKAALEWHAGYPHGNESFDAITSAELYERLRTALAVNGGGDDDHL